MYENMQAKYNEEVLALKSNHTVQLLESRKTIDRLNEMISDIRKENSIQNMTLVEVRADNNNLRNNCKLLTEHNEELQGRLREATEAPQMRSTEEQKQLKDKLTKEKKQPIVQPKNEQKKRKYGIHYDPDVMEVSEAGQCNVSGC